jgi:hypothetical protein
MIALHNFFSRVGDMLDFLWNLRYNNRWYIQYTIKNCRDKGFLKRNPKKYPMEGLMSKKSKKIWVRVVCAFLAALMIMSCVAILAPIF